MTRKFWARDSGTSVECLDVPAQRAEVAADAVAPSPELLRGLNPRLLRVLAGLHGAPHSIAEATIQLLPFGSRAALEAEELAVLEKDEDGQDFLRLTPRAYAAMEAAAAAADGTAQAVAEWEERLERAHLAVVTRRR